MIMLYIRRRHYYWQPVGPTDGFTLLELLIAASVFAVILLVLAVGIISFSNEYYQGITSSKTQATNRAVMNEIDQSIEFGKNVAVIPADASGVAGVCIDSTLFAYKLGQQVTDSGPVQAKNQGYHGLLEVNNGACTGSIPASIDDYLGDAAFPVGQSGVPAGGRELLGQRMRLNTLTVTPTGNEYTIEARLIYGDNTLLTPPAGSGTNWSTTTERCIGQAGSQFCSVSDLKTTVGRRLL